MAKYRFIQISVFLFQICLLIVLFIPFANSYGNTYNAWNLIVQAFYHKDTSKVLSTSLFYIPSIASLTSVVLFNASFKYVLVSVLSAANLTYCLIFYIFPALESYYLLETYQIGLYLSLILQILTIVFCAIAVNFKNTTNNKSHKFNSRENTKEIIIEDIKNQIKNLK